MPSDINYPHIYLRNTGTFTPFKSPRRGGGGSDFPQRVRDAHANKLQQDLTESLSDNAYSLEVAGRYLYFEGLVGYDLKVESLENKAKGIQVLNVKRYLEDGAQKTSATVFIPNGQEGFFLERIRQYKDELDPRYGKPKNSALITSIELIERAMIGSFWTDGKHRPPEDTPFWCEIWLRRLENTETQIEAFFSKLSRAGIRFDTNQKIIFPERIVLVAFVNGPQIDYLIHNIDTLAEFKKSQDPAGFWMHQTNTELADWTEDFKSRIIPSETNTRIAILDSGVNNLHPLLVDFLPDDQLLTVNPTWGVDDHEPSSGHGTRMAGLSLYGDLSQRMAGTEGIDIKHKLSSIKILPPPPPFVQTDPTLFGYITEQAILESEIQNPTDNTVYCMAVTSDECSDGQPSSWSARLDDIIFQNGEGRLFLLSAGNSDMVNQSSLIGSHIDFCRTKSVQDPSQAWNAIVVGAYTEKIIPYNTGILPIAEHGGISPHTTTSISWRNKWPIRPDVVFEGGNLGRTSRNEINTDDNFSLLSTAKNFTSGRELNLFDQTSAATALASNFCAEVVAKYNDYLPHTVRGLLIHSSYWTDTMLREFGINQRYPRKDDICRMMRCVGYGVPNLEKALISRENSLSLIVESQIQPYKKEDGKWILNEMCLHELPWPEDVLRELGETPVKLRVTLSYFIEPSPGERGWNSNYRYQSHGLRFELNRVNETRAQLISRINALVQAEEDDEDEVVNSATSQNWKIGANNRSHGSVHSDYWEGSAIELAKCNMIAVYPVIGWWRSRPHLGKGNTKSKYALIISLETPAEEVTLYTEILNQIPVPVTVEIETNL